MKAGVIALAFLLIGADASAASFADMWLRQDQRAQRLLQAGNADAASKLFTDPRRRAYAQLQAGRYADAAKELAQFHDADSQYNRGNALAHTGDLQGALKAYDAALQAQPKDKDARRNRDLVARELAKQKSQSDRKDSNKSGQDKSGHDNSGQGKSSQDKSSQGKSNQSNSDRQPSQKNDGHQDKNRSDKDKTNGNESQSSRVAATGDSVNKGDANKDSADKDRTAQSRDKQAAEKSEREQAKQDAEAGRAYAQRNGDHEKDKGRAANLAVNPAQDDKTAKQPAQATQRPPSEQTLALEQWLRRIPDDPGGLLRRKFLIEHMIKQQEAQQ